MAKRAPKQVIITVGRDAKNGQFIPVKEARRRPATTIIQHIKKG